MSQFLLDTSVIIDLLNNKNDRGKLIRQLLGEGNSFCCCAINIAEVYAGMRAKEKGHTEALLNSLHCYEITSSIAKLAGHLKYDWAKRGATLSISDTLIAAVALTHKLILMTDNLKHYPMSEIKTFDW